MSGRSGRKQYIYEVCVVRCCVVRFCVLFKALVSTRCCCCCIVNGCTSRYKATSQKEKTALEKKKGGHQRKYPLLFLLSLLFYCYYYCVGYRGTCPSRVVFLLLLFCSTCPSALECVNHLLPLISLFFFVSSPPPSSLFFSPCAPSSFFFFASHARLSAEHVHATEFRFLRACADAA